MQIHVSGKQVEVGESLRTHATSRLQEGISKYSDRVTAMNVVVSREAHLFRVDISGNIGTHEKMTVRAGGAAEDVYVALDEAVGKIEKQLRRYKRRLTNHHAEKGGMDSSAAALRGVKYILNDQADEAPDEKESPLVIAEQPMEIETLTVSQAVMRMDFSDVPALMFVNTASGRINIVYRRADGNISWVDPAEKEAA